MNKVIGLYFLMINFCFGMNYTIPEQKASYSVIINASLDKVWQYNSNNENAKQWSVYFKEIIPCPVTECPINSTLEPSEVGYIRRPIRYETNRKIWWDEKTILVDKKQNKIYKQILSYNFHTPFNILNFNKKAEYLVEQIYEKVSKNKTKLTFQTGFIKKEELKHHAAFYEYFVWKLIFDWKTKDIIQMTFEKNLKNIKHAIELGDNYKRIYPYESEASAFY